MATTLGGWVVSKWAFKGQSLSPVIRKLSQKSVQIMIYLSRPLSCSWWWDKEGWWAGLSTCSAWLCFLFNSVLVRGDQAWLNMKLPSVLKLFLLKCILIASFTRQSKYPDILFNIVVAMKLMRWSILMLFYATADFCGWYRLICRWCSLPLSLIVLPPCLQTLFCIHVESNIHLWT